MNYSEEEFTSEISGRISERKDIFISYARSDSHLVKPLVQAIESAGATTWIDTSGIDGGSQWAEKIVNAIDNAKVLLVAITPASVNSPNVIKELHLAAEMRKPLLPVFLNPTSLSGDFKYQLAGVQNINLFPESEAERRMEELIQALKKLGVSFPANKQEPWITPSQARQMMKQGKGDGVKIGVLSSGIDTSHPKLSGLRLDIDVSFRTDNMKVIVEKNTLADACGMGTALAGVLFGLAPNACLRSYKVLNERFRSTDQIISAAAKAAINDGNDIILSPLGRVDPLGRFLMKYKEWVDECFLRNIHIVTASNNDDYRITEWPGSMPTTLCVDAAKTEYPLLFRAGEMARFLAPGYDVEVPWLHGKTQTVTGSCFAAPRVAAYLAQIISEAGPISASHAQVLLQQIAEPWTPQNAGVSTEF